MTTFFLKKNRHFTQKTNSVEVIEYRKEHTAFLPLWRMISDTALFYYM